MYLADLESATRKHFLNTCVVRNVTKKYVHLHFKFYTREYLQKHDDKNHLLMFFADPIIFLSYRSQFMVVDMFVGQMDATLHGREPGA